MTKISISEINSSEISITEISNPFSFFANFNVFQYGFTHAIVFGNIRKNYISIHFFNDYFFHFDIPFCF
jgi:hypothetical protein